MNFTKRIRVFMAALAVFVGLSGALPALALADTSSKQTVCSALGSNASCTSDPHGSTSLNKVIKAVINILSFVIGLASVIMIMVGGFRYITAGGDSNSVSAAKNTILYAVIGLVVAAMAQAIVQFVLHKVK